MPSIRLMRRNDIPVAVKLTNLENWHFNHLDFGVMMKHWPDGNFVIEHKKGKVIGIGSVLIHGKLAWFSNFIVERKERGKGYGKELVNRAIQHAHRTGARSIGLYTYDDRMDFYTQFGFEMLGIYTAFSGRIKSGKSTIVPKSYDDIYMVVPSQLDGIVRLDRKAFGINRSEFLNLFYHYFRKMLLVHTIKNKVDGYIAAGSNPGGNNEIAQWVGKDPDTARSLLFALSQRTGDRPIWLLVPWDNYYANVLMEEYGLSPERNYIRMSLGESDLQRKKDWIYTLGGLEIW